MYTKWPAVVEVCILRVLLVLNQTELWESVVHYAARV